MCNHMFRKSTLLLLIILCANEVSAQITLQSYRDSVYVHSSEIANAEELLSRAYSASKMTFTDFLPQVDAEASLSMSLRRMETEKLWGFNITPRISQVLFGGGVRSRYGKSRSDVEVAALDVQYIMTQMSYQADYAYWTLSAMKLYELAVTEYVNIINSLNTIVGKRYAEGYVSKSDYLQVQARLREAEFALIASRKDYQVALHRFNNLRGVHEPTEAELVESILDSIELPSRVLYDEILERRADVRSAASTIRSAEFGVGMTKSEYNPKVELRVSGSWQTYSPNASNRTYVDGAILLGVRVPIFHWNERRHAIAMARSDVQIARTTWQQICDDIEQQEADGWSALQSSYLQMQSSLENLNIAGENLSISTYAYNEGQATLLEVLQAQISWIQIYTNAITARFNYAVAVSAYKFITATN